MRSGKAHQILLLLSQCKSRCVKLTIKMPHNSVDFLCNVIAIVWCMVHGFCSLFKL